MSPSTRRDRAAPEASGDRGLGRRLAAQYEIARALVDAERIEDAAPAVLRAVCELMEWTTASIWVLDADGARLRAAAVWPSDPSLDEWRDATMCLRLEIGEGIPGRAWQLRQPLWIADLSDDRQFPRLEHAARAGLRHGFAYPITTRGEVHAVIECFGPQIRAYDEGRIEFLGALAGQLGTFLERAAARGELAASEARKGAILAGAVDAVVSADAEGRIEEFNAAAERLFGYRRDEVIGAHVADLLVPPELQARHRAGLARYLATGEARILGRRLRTVARRAGGGTVPVELTVTAGGIDGRPIFTAFIRDVTEQLQAETARDRFLEILSHELRTPVTAIYGGTRLLERLEPGSESARELVRDVGLEADRLHRLVEDLIILARAERGATEVAAEPVHLARVAERVVRAERARTDVVQLELRRVTTVPPVLAEETYVEQVLRNLLGNAVKYGSSGGVVEIELEHVGDESVVRVLDRGPGIDEAEAPRLFDIGYRSAATARVAQGSGVGLFVARWLVEVLGGRIWARPRAGGGSEFGFALPVYALERDGATGVVTIDAAD